MYLQNISVELSTIATKKGETIGYDGFKRILGINMHVAVEQNGLPMSIVMSSANHHYDSTRFVDVMENISEHPDEDMIKQIKSVYADKGHDSKTIRNHLKNRNIRDCIP